MAKSKYTYNEKRKEWYTLVYDGTLTASGEKHRKRITSKKSSADLEKKVNAFKAELSGKGVAQTSNITFGEYSRTWYGVSRGLTADGKTLHDAFVFDEKGDVWVEFHGYRAIGQ